MRKQFTSETDGNVIICARYIQAIPWQDEKSGDHQSKNVSFEKGHVEKFEFGQKLDNGVFTRSTKRYKY